MQADEDVHVVRRNYAGDGGAFGNSLTVLVLRDERDAPLYRFGVIKEVCPPPEG